MLLIDLQIKRVKFDSAELPWLKDKPQCFHEMTAYMVLDDGCELPVHSVVLLMQSSVLCEAFAAHRNWQRDTGKSEPCRLRLEGCSLEEACSFIACFYMVHSCSMEQARPALIPPGCLLLHMPDNSTERS